MERSLLIRAAEWLSNDRGSVIQWEFHRNDLLRTWKVSKKEQLLFTERADRSEWGTFYFSAEAVSSCNLYTICRHPLTSAG